MITANNLIKTFTRTVNKKQKEEFNAVDGVSLSVNDGEIVGILGPNGAGKTTLLRMLCTLMTPTSGSISIESNGNTLVKPIDIKRHIGYLSANTKLYERFSVRETIRLYGQTYGMSDEALNERTDLLISLLNLDEFIDNKVSKLSTGQMQRAQIARCLIHDPDIYIFDEPTLGLDVISSTAIIEFMKNEKTKNKTILYSTHYMEEAQYLCDRVLLLSHGKIIADKSPHQLMNETGSETMREAFFKTIENAGESVDDYEQ